jgi:hypothetical protein
MSIILDRIKEFSENQNISIRQIEMKIGASNGVISNAIKKNTDIQSKWISIIIEKFPNLSHSWLLTGTGEMLNTKFEASLQSSKLEEEHAIYENSKLSDKEKIIQLEATIKELRGQVEYFRKLYEDAIKAK